MAQFYRIKSEGRPDTLYDAKTNQRIADVNAMKSGGYNQEIAAPTPKTGSVAIPNPSQIKNYNVTNNIGGTLYGVLKTPTSNDLSTGIKAASVTPPATTADLIHQTFADNAGQYSQSQKDLIAVREQQMTDIQKQIAETNKQIADNQAKIDQNTKDVKEAYTGSMDDPNLQGWRQSAIGITSDDLKAKYEDYKQEYDTRKSMGDELAQLTTMFSNELTKPQPLAVASVAAGRLNNLKETYISRISALQAGIAAIDGNITMAQTFIDRGIDTVNADRQDRLNYLNFVQNLASNKDAELKTTLLNLTNDEKEAINNEIAIITDQIKQTEENKAFIMTLLSDSSTAQTAIMAGVTITDTSDQAISKISNYYRKNPGVFTDLNTELKNLLLQKEIEQYGQTTEYKNYQLAGGIEGTGLDFSTWLQQGGNSAKPKSDTQLKAQTYADRMTNSNNIITKLENIGTSLWGVLTGNEKYPNVFKTSERQELEQAERDFVNATLRQESGAAIAESEFESATKQYFPQPGDSAAVIEQKRKNREISINGMMRQAGSDNSSAIEDGDWSW